MNDTTDINAAVAAASSLRIVLSRIGVSQWPAFTGAKYDERPEGGQVAGTV
jgi:hypothetical protein